MSQNHTAYDPVNYKAWANNMIGFIRERGMETAFTDWCGGWPYPGKPEPRDDLLEAAQTVLAGLNARVDAAERSNIPVFAGIADLHAAISKAKASSS